MEKARRKLKLLASLYYLLNFESEPVKLIIKFNVQTYNFLLYTSSIRLSFQPSNCMIILCSCVPWRKASTLVASA